MVAKAYLKLHFSLFQRNAEPSSAPSVYRPYLIIANAWQLEGSGIATIVPLHDDSPVPDQLHIVAVSGGSRAALESALNAIRALGPNANLEAWPPLDDLDEVMG